MCMSFNRSMRNNFGISHISILVALIPAARHPKHLLTLLTQAFFLASTVLRHMTNKVRLEKLKYTQGALARCSGWPYHSNSSSINAAP